LNGGLGVGVVGNVDHDRLRARGERRLEVVRRVEIEVAQVIGFIGVPSASRSDRCRICRRTIKVTQIFHQNISRNRNLVTVVTRFVRAETML
jgi:hypothetical protein